MSPFSCLRSGFPWLAVLATACQPGIVAGQDDEPEALIPGLVVELTHTGSPDVKVAGVVARPSWEWLDAAPDLRIPNQGFRLRAAGLLLIQAPGAYRFHARTDGAVRLLLGDKDVLRGRGGFSGEPVDLPPGFLRFALDYQRGTGPARLAIDWEGPDFPREPLPARLLSHGPDQAPPPDQFEAGRRLADRLGCVNCHDLPGLVKHPTLGPPLRDAVATTRPQWLKAWLHDPLAVRPGTPMPRYGGGLPQSEVDAIVAFLGGSRRTLSLSAEVRMALNLGSVEKGRLLFRSVGCLGCHSRSDAPEASGGGLRDACAPDLFGLGRERSAERIAAFLEHPRGDKVPSRHRPDLHLSAEEAAHLGVYLSSDVEPDAPADVPARSSTLATSGRQLVERLRCASCHEIDGLSPPPDDLPIDRDKPGDRGCLAVVPKRNDVPQFGLSEAQRASLRAFVEGRPVTAPVVSLATRADDAMRRRNCLGCHVRDGLGGDELAGRLAPLLARDRDLGPLKGTLTPPNLTAVGDKLRPEFLREAIRGQAPSVRPWLSVRMPTYAFEPDEAETIGLAFQSRDRTPPVKAARTTTLEGPRSSEIGAQLLGQKGFGCLSCHVVAGRIPPGGEPETLGPDLALADRRMTERYFRRWISDPQRVIAGTPMPQFLKAVEGPGLPPTLDEQLDAVWSLIRSPDLGRAVAFGTREVLRQEGDRAIVVRDMVLLPDAPETPYTPRGLAIGLQNGASLLFDTDRLTWLAWWRGGFLSRTKAGRLWEWHPEGRRVWVANGRLSPVAIGVNADGSARWPVEVRERFGSFRALEFLGRGVRLVYTLNRPEGGSVEVVETIQPLGEGWERRVEVSGTREGERPAIVEQPPPTSSRSADGLAEEWSLGTDRVRLRVVTGEPVEGAASGTAGRLFTMES
ncbi:MAG: c-type cytochrome, partial [Isosphaeraceae bacterium]